MYNLVSKHVSSIPEHRLLLADGHSCDCLRRTGEHERMSVRGFIVGQGEGEIAGLTETFSLLLATML
ncbi:hypothetical protein K438DRAFT_1987250 [Mycena galopus ATCC 62051]|nr:hypothetical protein K438DRAFT_1987250 [Mycena galopus ATCC 62051]